MMLWLLHLSSLSIRNLTTGGGLVTDDMPIVYIINFYDS